MNDIIDNNKYNLNTLEMDCKTSLSFYYVSICSHFIIPFWLINETVTLMGESREISFNLIAYVSQHVFIKHNIPSLDEKA